MKFPVKTEIARPLADVFGKLSDCRNEERWNSQVSSAKLVDGPDPPALGTLFNTINRGKQYAATLVVHDSEGRIQFDVRGKPMDIVATYALTPTASGTRVEGELEMQPKGFLKLLMPLLKGSIQKDLDTQYTSFKRFCETAQNR